MQNIYDNSVFFSEYKKFRGNAQGFNEQIEQPTIHSLIPNLQGKTILDLGCGFGNFCRYAMTQGASSIIGLDVSENMISEARKLNTNDAIKYQCTSIESAEFNKNQFDLVVSSFTIHYLEDYLSLVKKISLWLKKDGYFIFSVEHPICTANPDDESGKDENNREFHLVYNYRDEKWFTQTWFIDGVRKYHRTISTYVNTLVKNNFSICDLLEPMPNDGMIDLISNFSLYKVRPQILVIKIRVN